MNKLLRAENLPADLIHDILKRLPAEVIILPRNGYSSGSITLYSIQETTPGEITAKKSQIYLHNSLDLQDIEVIKLFSSCNGCFLFATPSTYLIFNPITNEQVTISNSPEFTLLGFYLHRKMQEYRIYCVHENRVIIYGTKSNTWRQISAMMEAVPREKTPVIVNGVLHWLVYFKEAKRNQIQIFDIETEKLGRIGVPVNLTKYINEFEIVEMSDDNGKSTVGFCDSCRPVKLDIWVLEDYANQVWKKRHTFYLGVRGETNVMCHESNIVRIYNNNELLVRWGGQYYHHNSKLDTWSKILELGSYTFGEAIHQNSLSLISLLA